MAAFLKAVLWETVNAFFLEVPKEERIKCPNLEPISEKNEKKSLFSAYCKNKTTLCHDRAFLKGSGQPAGPFSPDNAFPQRNAPYPKSSLRRSRLADRDSINAKVLGGGSGKGYAHGCFPKGCIMGNG